MFFRPNTSLNVPGSPHHTGCCHPSDKQEGGVLLAGMKPQPQQPFISSFGHCPNKKRPQQRGNAAEKTIHPILRHASFLSVPTTYREPQVKTFSAESKRVSHILPDSLFSSIKCNQLPLIKGLHPGSAGRWGSSVLNQQLFISAQCPGSQGPGSPH